MSTCTKSLLGAWPNLPGMGANTKSVPCALLCPLSGAPTPHSPLPGGGGGGGFLSGPQTGSQIHPPLPTLAHGGGLELWSIFHVQQLWYRDLQQTPILPIMYSHVALRCSETRSPQSHRVWDKATKKAENKKNSRVVKSLNLNGPRCRLNNLFLAATYPP